MLARFALRALEESQGNFTQAAKLLGIHPNNLHRIVRHFNLDTAAIASDIALRRAMGMAYNNGEAIRVLYSGRALPASGPIPRGPSGSRRPWS